MRKFIERQRHMLDYTLSSLLRRKGKNGALLLVYTLVVFFPASVLFFSRALGREAALVLEEAPEIIVQRTVAGRFQPVPLSYAEPIRRLRGVVSVRPRLWGYHYDTAFRANYTLMVPPEAPPARGTVRIGSGISRSRGALPGDIIALPGYDGKPHSFTVQQVFDHRSHLLNGDLLLLSREDYCNFSGFPAEHATDLAVRVRNPREEATIAEKIVRLYPDTRPIMRSEILRTYQAVFSWRSGLVMLGLGGSALAFLILAWEKATSLSIEERQEMGVLKAIGWETSDILLLKAWEGGVVSLTAFLLGTILAYGHVFEGSSFLFAPVIKGWSVLYPDFRLTPFVDAGELASLFFLTVIPYTVATLVPSWRTATMDADAVMR
jgi:hypothetical protein